MIGTRGHDIGKMSAQALAQTMQEKGFKSIQLVAYKSIEGIRDKSGALSPGLAYEVGHEFDKRGIHVALLGSYFNLLDPDKEAFNEGMKRFKEYLRFAKDFKCTIVGTETGSYNHDYTFNLKNHSEEALERVIDIFEELTLEAKNHGVMVGIEGVFSHVVSTPHRMKKVLDAVGSSNLQVIFDPVNLIHLNNYTQSKELIEEAFKLYGDRIVLIHAKDFVVEDGCIKTVPLGEGLLDYRHLIEIINQHKPSIDIIIEDLVGDDLERSKVFLEELFY